MSSYKLTEELKNAIFFEEYSDEFRLENNYSEVKRTRWTSDHKWQEQDVIFMMNGRLHIAYWQRNESVYTDWDYNFPDEYHDCVESVVTAYVAVKDQVFTPAKAAKK